MTDPHLVKKKQRSLSQLIDTAIWAHNVKLARVHAKSAKHPMAVFAHDYVGASINQFGVYEREELEVLFEFLRPLQSEFRVGTALDVGAFIGSHSIYFADHFRDVHAFEPNPTSFALLSFNADPIENIRIHNYGLGDRAGSFALIGTNGNLGRSSISSEAVGEEPRIDVDVRTLDATALNLGRLVFMKIDVEGFEERALKGGSKTIERHQPLIVLEQHPHDFSHGTSPAVKFLVQRGYAICWHQRGGPRSANRPLRWLQNLKEIVTGRTHSIVSGEQIPAASYPMLIAIPERFQSVLLRQPQPE